MRVAITGATGSLGGALIKRIAETGGAERIVSLSRDEVKSGELAERWSELSSLRCMLGDVRDAHRLEEVFRGCDTVIHCAALKQITHSVYSPGEMVKTNVQGTLNVIHAAMAANVQRVLVISSDKCCAPVNLYGATKFVAECYAVQSNSYSLPRGMSVACARYGNVLGSRGSVVHIWREQLRQGQPLMITDPGMTRFIITLRQAADFVLRALADMEGGEVFVPRLPAARIETLAQAVTDDYWHGPTAMTTTVTGLRPGGEKLHETLLTSEEPGRTWWEGDSFKRMIVLPGHHSWRETFLPPPKYVPVEQPYTSDAADRMLSVSELVDMLRDVP